MNWTIEFLPFLPVPYLVAAGLVALLVALLLIWRGRRGALLRIASLAILILALANPNLKQEEREQLANIAVVMVDQSASQRIAGREERTAASARTACRALRQYGASGSAMGGKLGRRELSAEETTLFTDLNRALSDIPAERLAGVVMLTDGQIHDVPTEVKKLGFDAPVHSLIVGTPDEFDNRLEVVSAPRFGLVGSEQTVELRALTSRKDRRPVAARHSEDPPRGAGGARL